MNPALRISQTLYRCVILPVAAQRVREWVNTMGREEELRFITDPAVSVLYRASEFNCDRCYYSHKGGQVATRFVEILRYKSFSRAKATEDGTPFYRFRSPIKILC